MAATQLDIVQLIKTKPGELKAGFDSWLAKQPVQVEVLMATLAGGGQGAFLGAVMGGIQKMDPEGTGSMLKPPIPANASPAAAAQLQAMNSAGPFRQAANFAVMTGVNAGLSLAIKRYRGGVEDLQGAMMAAFGSGAAFSLVSGMATGPSAIGAAVTAGAAFAVFQGVFFQLGKSFSKGGGGKVEDVQYLRAKYMLENLGLGKYEKNIRKGQLTDATVMLWNDRALQEVKIPAGPRLLILHHIDRYKHILKPGMSIPMPPPPPAAAPTNNHAPSLPDRK